MIKVMKLSSSAIAARRLGGDKRMEFKQAGAYVS